MRIIYQIEAYEKSRHLVPTLTLSDVPIKKNYFNISRCRSASKWVLVNGDGFGQVICHLEENDESNNMVLRTTRIDVSIDWKNLAKFVAIMLPHSLQIDDEAALASGELGN